MTNNREDLDGLTTQQNNQVQEKAHIAHNANADKIGDLVGASAQDNNYPDRSRTISEKRQATAEEFEMWRRIPTETALAILQKRGGHPGALAEAALLCIRKSQDYNPGQPDTHNVDRTSYFPFGATSYAQMLHTKANRFISIVQKQRAGEGVNFESLRDTALDIINYAGFYLADPRTPK